MSLHYKLIKMLCKLEIEELNNGETATVFVKALFFHSGPDNFL